MSVEGDDIVQTTARAAEMNDTNQLDQIWNQDECFKVEFRTFLSSTILAAI